MVCDVSNHVAPAFLSALCCHEIAGGPTRSKFLDEPCGILVVCWYCNGEQLEDKKLWPRSKQLALLNRVRPGWYDLDRFCNLAYGNTTAITPQEVNEWVFPP